MLSAKELRRLARQAGADKARHLELAEQCGEQEKRLDEMADEAERQGLHSRGVTARVNSQMHSEHRLAIAKGQAKSDKKFKGALRAKGFSQGGLARAIDIQPSLLSMYRTGERKIPLSRAKRIEELTGWSPSSWPGVVSDA